jgi:cytochrome c
MKLNLLLALLLGASLPSAHAQSDKDMKELLQASGCMSCHATDEKVVGPAFQAIAAKYAGQADAVDSLVQSIRNGSKGKWGRMPMPPHSSLSGDDLKKLSTWVMAQKKP